MAGNSASADGGWQVGSVWGKKRAETPTVPCLELCEQRELAGINEYRTLLSELGNLFILWGYPEIAVKIGARGRAV